MLNCGVLTGCSIRFEIFAKFIYPSVNIYINMKLTKKIIFIIAIIVILGIWIFPKNISTCGGDRLCFGYVKTEIQKSTWLNVKDSVFEVQEDEVKSCIGPELQYSIIMDGCPGAWGWFNARPVNCDSELKYCSDPSKSRYGIQCSEWQRVCEEIKSNNSVPIIIDNINETHVRIEQP